MKIAANTKTAALEVINLNKKSSVAGKHLIAMNDD